MNTKQYHKREMLGILIWPAVLAVVVLIASLLNIITNENARIFWTWVGISTVAGVIGYLISYKLAFKKSRKR